MGERDQPFPELALPERPDAQCTSVCVKIATYNVNGINGRLAVLLRWLELAEPDVACLQELKAPDASFPEAAIRDLGYHAIWTEELERRRDPEPRRLNPRDPPWPARRRG